MSEERNRLVLKFIGKTIENDKIKSESMRLTRTLSDEGELTFGKCNTACFEVTIYDDSDTVFKGNEVKPTLYVVDDNGNQNIYHLGVFTVEKETVEGDSYWKTLTCYDKIYYMKNIDITDYLIEYIRTCQKNVSSYIPNVFSGYTIGSLTSSAWNYLTYPEVDDPQDPNKMIDHYEIKDEVYEAYVKKYPLITELIKDVMEEYNIEILDTPFRILDVYFFGCRELMNGSLKVSLFDFLQSFCQVYGVFGYMNYDGSLDFIDILDYDSFNKIYAYNMVNNSFVYETDSITLPQNVKLVQTTETKFSSKDVLKSNLGESSYYFAPSKNVNWSTVAFDWSSAKMIFQASSYYDSGIYIVTEDGEEISSSYSRNSGDKVTIENNFLLQRQGYDKLKEVAKNISDSYYQVKNYDVAEVDVFAKTNGSFCDYMLGDWVTVYGNNKTKKFPIMKMTISGIENVIVHLESDGTTEGSGSSIGGSFSGGTISGGTSTGSNTSQVSNIIQLNSTNITSENIKGDSAEIDLKNGTFDFNNGGLTWDGSDLKVNGVDVDTSSFVKAEVYDASVGYSVGDIITYDGKLYVVKVACKHKIPPNSVYYDEYTLSSKLKEIDSNISTKVGMPNYANVINRNFTSFTTPVACWIIGQYKRTDLTQNTSVAINGSAILSFSPTSDSQYFDIFIPIQANKSFSVNNATPVYVSAYTML